MAKDLRGRNRYQLMDDLKNAWNDVRDQKNEIERLQEDKATILKHRTELLEAVKEAARFLEAQAAIWDDLYDPTGNLLTRGETEYANILKDRAASLRNVAAKYERMASS